MFTRTWFKDTLERALATFVEAALGVWILDGALDVLSVSTLEGVGTAGLIAGLAVIKGAVAGKLGQQGASLDPSLATVEVAVPQVP